MSTSGVDVRVGDTFQISATGGPSGSPITYSIDTEFTTPGVCSVSASGLMSFPEAGSTGLGFCWVNVNQAGGNGYPAAPQKQKQFIVRNSQPVITGHPTGGTFRIGDTVTLTSTATGSAMNMQWQVSTNNGQSWAYAGSQDPTFAFEAQAFQDGYRYRAVYTNSAGPATFQSATTNAVTIQVRDPITIVHQPTDTYPLVPGLTNAGFGAMATGVPNPTPRWQQSTDGGETWTEFGAGTWFNFDGSGQIYANLEFAVTAEMNGYLYRVVYTNANESVASTAGRLNVLYPPSIVTEPTDQTIVAGDDAAFTLAADGNPTPTIQWEESTDGGATFHDVGGASSPTLTLPDVTRAMDGNQYKARVSAPSATVRFGVDVVVTRVATLTVTKPPLTVTADDETITYGEDLPEFTVAYDGFVGDDDAADLGGALSCTAGPVTGAGAYDITCDGLTSDDYEISYPAGTLTAEKAPLTVTADDHEITYGELVPELTAEYVGFVGEDGPTSLTGTLTCSTGTVTGVDEYEITCSGLTSDDYEIAYEPGTLDVGAAALTVTADPQTMTYGGTEPAFTVSYSTFVGDDAATDLGGELSCATDEVSGAGLYDITCDGLTSDDYVITFVEGTLTVGKAALTITGKNASAVYGDSPELTATYAGFVGEDGPSALTGTLACTTAPVTGIGPYEITCSGLTSGDYEISYAAGSLTVTAAPLTLTADSTSVGFGLPLPAFTVTPLGLVNGDDPSVLTGTLSCSTPAVTGAGPYPITCSGLTAANYEVTFAPGTLTVFNVARPDAQVRKGTSGKYVGDNVYFPPTVQDVNRTMKVGAGGTFQVLIQNDSNVTDTFRVQAMTRIEEFSAKYSVKNRNKKTDITRAVAAGTYSVTLEPGGSVTVSITVSVNANARPGKSKPFYVTVTSTLDPAASDRVSATARAS
jgi:hypothetical protein